MLYELEGRRPTTPEPGQFFVADNATVLGQVTLAVDSSIWFNAVLRGDNDEIVIGRGSNIQDGSVLHTDPGYQLTVGEGVTVGHQAMLHGCSIGDNSLIGMKAIVLNGAKIGRNCLIGAGALIAEGKTIPDNSMVIGVPGRVKRELSAQEIEGLQGASARYVANYKRFLASFGPV
ncbi:gamma carbonic anhydrase family protein [Salinisphaera aquimarina]|uniref:Gamma carbonic anhydrase family protein n=1 Tax=Salinisphaera aquimarina TaxID=2094031 RepID=A0ABV7EW44_9GAMM